MFNKSLKELTSKGESQEERAEQLQLQKLLDQEYKENYEGWLSDPITKKVLVSLEEEVERNKTRLLQHCLGTGLDRPVEERRVLYYSLKNKIIGELLRALKK